MKDRPERTPSTFCECLWEGTDKTDQTPGGGHPPLFGYSWEGALTKLTKPVHQVNKSLLSSVLSVATPIHTKKPNGQGLA
jgi:hypothetical protein